MTDLDLADWLGLQLDADEAAALAAAKDARAAEYRDGTHWRMSDEGLYCEWRPIACGPYGYLDDDIGNHIAHWDPARVLAEIAAKRRLLAFAARNAWGVDGEWGDGCTLEAIVAGKCDDRGRDAYMEVARLLAAPYAGRDGWSDAWALT